MIQGGLIVFTVFAAYCFGVVLPYLRQRYMTDAMRALYSSVVMMFLVAAVDNLVWILPEMFIDETDLYLSITNTPWLESILLYFDTITLPVAMLVGYSLTTGKFRYANYMALAGIYALLCIIENITGFYNLQYYTGFFTFVFCLIQLAWCWRYIRKYEERLRNNYSNIEHRSMRWFLRIIIPIFVLALIYTPLCIFTESDVNSIIFDLLSVIVFIFSFFNILNYQVDNKTEQLVEEQFKEIINIQAEPCEAPTHEEEESHLEEVTLTQEYEEGDEHPFASKIKALEEKHFYLDADVSIEWLCNKLGTNRHYVSDYLNNELHVSFYEYINNLRLMHAENLLRQGEKVSQVAYRSGFNSDHTFRRLFKEKFSITPSQFIKQAI
ncbi:MAG: helix-turn-helix transcriptional regulator [Bacteroidaceae bacterium]|nr:helix-turn-helix transcriptional regulator [Bacteroidaceae bacterium]